MCDGQFGRFSAALTAGLWAVLVMTLSAPVGAAAGVPITVRRAPAALAAGTLVHDPAGFTVGGKPVPWGGTVTLSRANVSQKQAVKFTADNQHGGWFCIFDWSENLRNAGFTPTGRYYQVIPGTSNGSASPVTFKPGVAAGQVVVASDWLGLKPGPNAVEVRLNGFHSYTDTSGLTQDKRTLTVVVQGSCEPNPAIGRAPAPVTKVVPDLVEKRLQQVGLDPGAPGFAAKLKLLAAQTGAAYVRTHVLAAKFARIGRVGPGHVMSATGGGAASASHLAAAGAGSSAGRVPTLQQAHLAISPLVHGGIIGVYGDQGKPLGPSPALSSSAGTVWPGRYFFLVHTTQPVPVKGGPMFSLGTTSLSYGCSAQLGILFTWAGAADDANFIGGSGLNTVSSGPGSYNYYVGLDVSSLPIGQERPAQLALSFENASTGGTGVELVPDTGGVTIDVTVDHTPELTGLPYVYPWGETGMGPSSATLADSGTPRVGAGNWQTQTSGDDLVGLGVQLGPGWKVTSTTIRSAVSAAAPSDTSPDNTWRGAEVTTAPQGNDLRTAVHWHYSGIDSLDYTVEWQLTGPAGQRPLLTMQKHGSCDS
ncbi:MAG: hypothetical protein PHQ91_02085 [Thermoanaerobaculaceae bacterium]|nr:hypothetical protein [Thermoanaerobaculaceae bacterium]